MLFLRVLNPAINLAALRGAADLIIRQRSLVAAMTIRELRDRYAGQALGVAWAIITPLLTMGIYVWVFTFVFKGRLGHIENTAAFTAYALAGLAPWLSFSDGVSRAVNVVTGNANLVKQIVFPVEVLPLKIVLATFPTLAVGLCFAVGASIVGGVFNPLMFLLLPVALVCYFLFVGGLAFFLAALGVFLRDIKDVVVFFLGIGMFLCPIIYPPGAGPPWLQVSFAFNPVANMIYCFHDVIVGRVDPAHHAWVVFPMTSLLVFVIGWRTFNVLKPAFGNAL